MILRKTHTRFLIDELTGAIAGPSRPWGLVAWDQRKTTGKLRWLIALSLITGLFFLCAATASAQASAGSGQHDDGARVKNKRHSSAGQPLPVPSTDYNPSSSARLKMNMHLCCLLEHGRRRRIL